MVTDRVELDDQIAKTFKVCGAVSEAEGDACHAGSGAELRRLLAENHRYVFTLIHKFQTPEVLCDRADVIVLTDEAHRSQYDTLARVHQRVVQIEIRRALRTRVRELLWRRRQRVRRSGLNRVRPGE